ncbi:MAG: hypothetical protein ACI83I_000619 [Bacteroidia bacterium]|jgi:hypothetical protein
MIRRIRRPSARTFIVGGLLVLFAFFALKRRTHQLFHPETNQAQLNFFTDSTLLVETIRINLNIDVLLINDTEVSFLNFQSRLEQLIINSKFNRHNIQLIVLDYPSYTRYKQCLSIIRRVKWNLRVKASEHLFQKPYQQLNELERTKVDSAAVIIIQEHNMASSFKQSKNSM